jgi:hypothetical protein
MNYILKYSGSTVTAVGDFESLLPKLNQIHANNGTGSIFSTDPDEEVLVLHVEGDKAFWGPGATTYIKHLVLRDSNIDVDKVKAPDDLERFADRVKALRLDLLCQFDSAGLPIEVPEYVTQALNSLDNAASQLRIAQYRWSREIGGRR